MNKGEYMSIHSVTVAVNEYLNSVKLARSPHTASTYGNALNYFLETLRMNKIDPGITPIADLSEDTIVLLASSLKDHAATTERLYLTATSGFFEYLAAEKISLVNLPRIKLLIHQRARRPGQRLPQFPASLIDQMLNKICTYEFIAADNETYQLINLRDKAFLLTLADTGLRVHEACGLRRGDIDWNEGKAMIIGKGNRQDIVRFSTRSTA
jgi:integrase/recombinase XerC